MTKAKILIVEDETITALYIQECLENLGYEVLDTAGTGYDAIDIAESLNPDLVLMDIKLTGEMDGIETASIIYNRFNIPIVYLTAFSDNNTLNKAKLTGSYGYLCKPVEEKALNPTIEIALSRHNDEIKLKKDNQWLYTMVRNLNDAIIAIDTKGAIKFANYEAEVISGWQNNELEEKKINELFQLLNTGESLEEHLAVFQKNSGSGKLTTLHSKNKLNITVEYNLSPITDIKGQVLGMIITFNLLDQRNIRKHIDSDTLETNIKKLNQLLGLCSFCKKIRNDEGQWSQLEAYIQKQFDILFSHGVCPDCSKKYYPEFFS
jgi:PAS domain S-box-containing protein